MKETIISNITRKDFEGKRIRILSHQKELFPQEQYGFPKTYDVIVTWGDSSYRCTYRIGSKDGKARSGVLRLKDGLAEVLGDRVGMALALKRIDNNKYYLTAI
jgi:hypothetical protein